MTDNTPTLRPLFKVTLIMKIKDVVDGLLESCDDNSRLSLYASADMFRNMSIQAGSQVGQMFVALVMREFDSPEKPELVIQYQGSDPALAGKYLLLRDAVRNNIGIGAFNTSKKKVEGGMGYSETYPKDIK